MKKRNLELHNTINDIFASPKPELNKLSEAFHAITSDILTHSEREQDLLRALGNQDGLVREQIKMSTLKHAVQIFEDCYFRATGQSSPTLEEYNG